MICNDVFDGDESDDFVQAGVMDNDGPSDMDVLCVIFSGRLLDLVDRKLRDVATIFTSAGLAIVAPCGASPK